MIWLSGLLLLAWLASPTLLAAQDAEADTTEAVDDTTGADDETADDEQVPGQDYENIDDILAQDEEVLYGNDAYTYDPGTRRDPFRSLLEERRIGDDFQEARPEGIAGLAIDEIELQGVFITIDGPVAQVQAASNETSYLLRPGDQLWDGDVVSISEEDITFKQSISDPAALKPFRDVVKRLNPGG